MTSDNSNKTIKIAVSSCLAGHNVRYDGKNRNNNIIHQLCERFDCISLCPESDIGLGTPRPPLDIIRIDNSFRVRGKTNPSFDVTDKLLDYATRIASQHKDICGYIFKSRSPSCGVNSTPWKDTNEKEVGITNGIFSAQIKQLLPSLPTIEETQLINSIELETFIQDVLQYAKEKSKLEKMRD